MSDNVNFKYHAFISYRNVAPYCARSIYYALSALGYMVFFDKEKLEGGNYTNQIRPAIINCDYFLLILTKQTFDGRDPTKDYLLKEIALAKETKDDQHIIPICIDGFDIQKDLPEDLQWLSQLQKVDVKHESFDADIKTLVSPKYFKDIDLSLAHVHKRVANHSYKKRTPESTTKELGRLETQFLAYEYVDSPVIQEVLAKYPLGFTSLDVGCAKGDRGMFYFGEHPKCKKHIAIDYNPDFIEKAKNQYGTKASFYEVNIEDVNFIQNMQNILKENNLTGFDVIHVALVMLHIEQPDKLIENLYKLLNPGGSIIIIDLDDGYNIAYPDDRNDFKRVNRLCFELPITGHRHTGRQLYTYLKQNKYTNIELKHHIVSTNNWDKDMREKLFDGRIGLVKRVLTRTVDKYKTDPTKLSEYKHFNKELVWLESVFNSLHREFVEESFFYTCTHMIYVADKPLNIETRKGPIKFR